MKTRIWLCGVVAILTLTLGGRNVAAENYYVFVGSGQDGLYRFELDTNSGAASAIEHITPREGGIGFFEFSPDRRFLYGVSRSADRSSGAAVAYALDRATGGLSYLNESDTRSGSAHIGIDATGKMVAVANYSGASAGSLPVKPDGTLGEMVSYFEYQGSSVHERQNQSHPHSANFTPDSKYLVVPDLGTDRLNIYKVDPATATLTPNEPTYFTLAPGSGPRHMTFHPARPLAFVINELASTIAVLEYDAANGSFVHAQTIGTLPEDFTGENTTAEVLVHPNGKFVYGSNRGHNSIAVFTLAADAPKLTLVEREPTGGDHPRNFRLSPDGKFLIVANMNTGNLVFFRIDAETGALAPSGTVLEVPRPMCVRFLEKI